MILSDNQLFKIKTLLFFTILISNIVFAQESTKIKARLIVCYGLSEKNIPLNNLKEINVVEGSKVYFYVKWFNLNKKNYTVSFDFLDEDDNYLVQSSAYKFKPKRRTHNTWNSRKFREVIMPEGAMKTKIILDGQAILEKKINVKYIKE